MTGRDTPAPDAGARLLDASGVPGDPALLQALEGIGVLAAGPAPEASAELAQLMAAGGRAPLGRRNKRRITFLGGALAVSMGVGMSGVAAGTFPFQSGPEDSSGAGTRFAARESADRVPTLPVPAPEQAERSEDSTHRGAGHAPVGPGMPAAVGAADMSAGMGPGAAGAALPVREDHAGGESALPAGAGAASVAEPGAALPPVSRPGLSSWSVDGSAGPGVGVVEPLAVHHDPVHPDRPSPLLPGAAASKGNGAPDPSTSARGTHSGTSPSISTDSRSGPRGTHETPPHRPSGAAADGGGFAAVGQERPAGDPAQGAVSEEAGASVERRASVARLQAPSWERFSGAAQEGAGFQLPAAEQHLMFSLFLGGSVADAGEWIPDDLLPVLPEDVQSAVEPSPVPADSTAGGPMNRPVEDPVQEELVEVGTVEVEPPADPLAGKTAAPAVDPLDDAGAAPAGPSDASAGARPGGPTEQAEAAQDLYAPAGGRQPSEPAD